MGASEPYVDRPVRIGTVHISAPHMYAMVLDALVCLFATLCDINECVTYCGVTVCVVHRNSVVVIPF